MSARPAASPPARRRLLLWALSAAMGGFLFGYHAGVLAGALGPLRREFGLTSFQQGVLVGLLPLGAMAGSLLNRRLADSLGRRRSLLLDAVVFLVGTAISTAAPDYAVLLVGRALVGLAVGAASSSAPLYLSEIAPSHLRGRLVTLNQVLVTLGIVVAYLVDLAFSGSGSWRWMIGLGLVPAAVFLLGMLRSPESPAWLDLHGRGEDARRILAEVAGAEEADRLLASLRASRVDSLQQVDLRTLLRSGARTALVVGVVLAVIQQWAGINAVVYYAPTIMQHTGLSASTSIVYSVIVGSVNAAATLPALRLIERLGRRPLLLGSLLGCLVSLVLLGLTFVVPSGFSGSWLSLLFLLAYIVAFAVGLGPVFWVLIAEIFPSNARAAGAGVATAANWFSNFLVGLLFLPLVDGLGPGGAFFVFAGVCAFGLVFVREFVPETAGRDFAEIDAELRSRADRRHRSGRPHRVPALTGGRGRGRRG